MKSSTVASLASATVTAFSLMTTNYSLEVDALCLKKIALKLHVGVTSSVPNIKVDENLGDASDSESDSHPTESSTNVDSESDSHFTDDESEREAPMTDPKFVPSQSRKSGDASIDAICNLISKRGADERERVLLNASIRPDLPGFFGNGKNFLDTPLARELAAEKAEGKKINKCLESLEEIKEHLSKKSKNTYQRNQSINKGAVSYAIPGPPRLQRNQSLEEIKEIKEDSWVHWFSQIVEKCFPVPRHEGVEPVPRHEDEGDEHEGVEPVPRHEHEGVEPVPRHEAVDVLPVPRHEDEGDMALSNYKLLLERAGVSNSKQARVV